MELEVLSYIILLNAICQSIFSSRFNFSLTLCEFQIKHTSSVVFSSVAEWQILSVVHLEIQLCAVYPSNYSKQNAAQEL